MKMRRARSFTFAQFVSLFRFALFPNAGDDIKNKLPIFPIHRCSQLDAERDFIQLKRESFTNLIIPKQWKSRSKLPQEFVKDYVVGRSVVGNKSSSFYHWQSRMACDSNNCPAPIRAWYDSKLHKNIASSQYYEESHKSALTMRGYIASQFRPSAAKCLYEVFEATSIYDPCGGWGDRLSAALAHSCHTYHCRDVNPLVFTGYALQQHAFDMDSKASFEYQGSEIDCPAEGAFDFVFTSPPYWKVEKYAGDKQSFRVHKKFDAWMSGFLFPMLKNAWAALEDGGVMAINVSDCYANHTQNIICEPAIEYALENLSGCHMAGIIGYEISTRKKNGCNSEPILIFSKNAPLCLDTLLAKQLKQQSLEL